mgnify:CR=1 FL=1
MKTMYPKSKDPAIFIIEPEKEILKMACCDCGLTHFINIKYVEGANKLSITFSLDRRATGQLRRHKYGFLQQNKE